MKLKNKKTGEIVEVESLDVDTPTERIVGIPSFDRKGSYSSLAELNEEWEDYEEPKEYYFIHDDGSGVGYSPIGNSTVAKRREAIGNYFETKEEAEKAVEKLKAWKRLKDRGFRFIDHTDFDDGNITIWGKFDKELNEEDVHSLFGGEE